MTKIHFAVLGKPEAQGSTVSWRMPTGRVITKHANKDALLPWRARVAAEAQLAMRQSNMTTPFDGQIQIFVDFTFTPPKYIQAKLRKQKGLRLEDVPHVVRPDLDKLTRAIGDALKGVVYLDDAQVVWWAASKGYGESPGAEVTIIFGPVSKPTL